MSKPDENYTWVLEEEKDYGECHYEHWHTCCDNEHHCHFPHLTIVFTHEDCEGDIEFINVGDNG